MKICTKCKTEQPFECFSKNSRARDKLCHDCKSCQRAYREANKDAVKARAKRYYQRNKEKIKQRTNEYYHSNIDTIRVSRKDFRERNKERLKAERQQYYRQNKQKINAKSKEYREKNKEKVAAADLAKIRKRRANDPVFRLSESCRSRINMFMKASGFTKKAKTTQMLGVMWQDLKLHLESQFKPGMCWDNYGEWHVDHVIPLSRAMNGGLYTPEELCHYTNLQPLWAIDNLQKSNK